MTPVDARCIAQLLFPHPLPDPNVPSSHLQRKQRLVEAQLEDLAEGQRVCGGSRQLFEEVLRNREGFGALVEELAPSRQAGLELLRV